MAPADDLVLTSTTDNEADMAAALRHGTEIADDVPVLSVEDRATGDVIVTEPEPKAEEKVDDKAAEKEPVVEKKADDAAKPEFSAKVQKRIDKITYEREEAKRQTEAERKRVEELLAEMALLKAGGKADAKPDVVEEEPPVPTADARLKPFDVKLTALETQIAVLGPRPKLDAFDTTEAWEVAVGERQDKIDVLRNEINGVREDRAVEKAKIAIDAASATTTENVEARERQAQFYSTLDEVKARHEDFDEKIAASGTEPIGVAEAVIFERGMEDAIGHELAYHLATHPDERKQIAELSKTNPQAALRIVHRIEFALEEQFKEKAAETKPAPAKPKAVEAKPLEDPITPVGSRSVTTTRTIEEADKADDQAAFKAMRAQQERNRLHNGRRR